MTASAEPRFDRTASLSPRDDSSIALPAKALIAFVLVSTVGIFASTNDALLSAVPLVSVLVAYLFFTTPVRIPFMILVFVAAVVDSDRIPLPSGGSWAPPQYVLNTLLFENLNKVIPVQALTFRFVEVLYLAFGALIAVRLALRIRIDRAGTEPSTDAITTTMLAALVGAIVLIVWGVILKGGDFRQSYYQARQMLWVPLLTIGGYYCIRDIRDFDRMANLMIVAACVKIFFVFRFYMANVRGTTFEPPYLTTHTDSILFVVAFIVLLSRFLHRANWRNLLMLAGVGGWLLLGITINNRRLAFVNIGVAAVLIVIMLRGPVKRIMKKMLLWITPALVLYLIVGQRGNSAIFAPAKMAMSVITQKDASSATRDIENYNLLFTLKQNVLMGQGFGHMYIELVQAFDISGVYQQYRYMAHNCVLWLWSLGGLLGFTVLWMPISVGIYLGRRAYLNARTSTERSSIAIAISMIVVWMMQAWGDLGLHQLNAALTLAIGLAFCAKMSVTTGSMPMRLRYMPRRMSPPMPETSVDLPVSST